MAQPSNLLYCDLIDHLTYNVQGGAIDPEQRDYRVACQNALREVVNNFNWAYYYTQARINTVDAYSTGTISSSGTTVTGSGTTFPSWAKYGRLVVDGIAYTIASRGGDTSLTLDSAPITAFASGTEYALYQAAYPLPVDFRSMDTPLNSLSTLLGEYITPGEWLTFERQTASQTGPARYWTIMADADEAGRMALVVWPYPSDAVTIDYVYQRKHRRMRLTGYESASYTGTVSASAGGTTVTGSGTTFSAGMLDAFIRFGDASNIPDGDGGLFPYTEQYKVISYTDATHVEVYPAITTAVSGVKFRVSDPVDIWQGMQTAVLRRAEYELAIARGKDMGVAEKAYFQSLMQARESDQLVLERRVAGGSEVPQSMLAYPTEAI